MQPRQTQFVLVTGATRSGKSRFAVERAKALSGPIVYIATCRGGDAEMRRRITRHRQDRPKAWRTIEHPRDLAKTLRQLEGKVGGVILDCLTMYVSELLMRGTSEAAMATQIRRLCQTIRADSFPVLMVTNEVGSGVVPDHALGRAFRDRAGLANQIAAEFADEVVFLVAGIPWQVKGPPAPLETVHAPA